MVMGSGKGKEEKVISTVALKLGALNPSPNKDLLLPLLKQAANALQDLDQSKSLKPAIEQLSYSLREHGLLQHKDKDVQFLVSICFCEIVRILAPEPDFVDSNFQDIFKLFLILFSDLADEESPYFSRRLKVLETIDKLKLCEAMSGKENSEDLFFRMFITFFTVIREDHPRGLFRAMSSIMVQVLKVKRSPPAVNLILHNLLKGKKGASRASSRLGLSVIKDCAAELEHPICEFLNSCIVNREAVKGELKEFYHEILFEIFQCAPKMLMTVISNLRLELLADQVDIRIRAINLVGRLLVLPGHHVAQDYRHLFVEFIKRYSDKSADVRMAAIRCVKTFYDVNPHGSVALDVLTALEGRLLDFDDRVRTQAVVTVCDLARANLKSLPPELLSRATERLHDKRVSVRKKAMQKLLEVYQEYCAKHCSGTISPSDNFEEIPCRILMLCYHRDCTEFKPQNMEFVLAEELFPTSLSIKERTRCWSLLFSLFKPAHLKALNIILSQKRRFQIEMRVYLALRNSKEDIRREEVQQKIQTCVAKMTALLPDPRKAEESFDKLNSLHYDTIFTTLMQLMDEVSIETAQTTRINQPLIQIILENLTEILVTCSINLSPEQDNFLKSLGKKHPHFEFLQLLSKKCLFNIFSSEHVHCIVDDLLSSSGDNMENSSVNLFLAIISAFPVLLRSVEKQFRLLLLEDKLPMNGQLMQMLAHAGPYNHIKISDIYPSLEKICLDGTRTQSKLAVSVIAAFSDTSEQLAFTGLSETLVDALLRGHNIPTVLQSLGCMAQYSVSSFESRAGEIYQYIFEEMFQLTDVRVSDYLDSCKESSEDEIPSIWKIFAIKTLVRSFLPHKSTTFGRDISPLIEVLSQMLQTGYISSGAIPCDFEKAKIKLAAAKSVLRLSRKWDLHIPPQLFHFTILMAKDRSSSVRRQVIDKIHKLLKYHAVPNKYACAFALAASDPLKDLQDNSFKYMEDFVRGCQREVKIRQISKKVAVIDSPAYVMVFLIHVLAHDPCFPSANCEDEEIWVQFLSPLVRVLEALVSHGSMEGDKNLIIATVSWLHTIFLAVMRAEDAVDVGRTPKLYMLADMGITILNTMTCNKTSSSSHTLDSVLLPSSLYRINQAERREEENLNYRGRCPLKAKVIKKVVSGEKSRISWSNMVNEPGQKVQNHPQSDIIKCSMKNLESHKNDDMPMNVEEQIQCTYSPGQELHGNMKLDSNTKRSRKMSLFSSPPRPGGLCNEFSIDDEAEDSAFRDPKPLEGRELLENKVLSISLPRSGGLHNEFSIEDDIDDKMLPNSEPLTGKEQIPSSCDSATGGNLLPRRKDKCAIVEGRCKDVEKNCRVLVGQRIRLWSPVDKCYYSGTVVGFDSGNDTHKITYDTGDAEVVNLGSERWESMSNDSLHEKDSSSFSSQYCDPVNTQSQMDTTSQDDVFQSKGKGNKRKKTFSKKRITRPGKENKGHNAFMDTSASEIINLNEEPVARRTRRRK